MLTDISFEREKDSLSLEFLSPEDLHKVVYHSLDCKEGLAKEKFVCLSVCLSVCLWRSKKHYRQG